MVAVRRKKTETELGIRSPFFAARIDAGRCEVWGVRCGVWGVVAQFVGCEM